jgi:diguanylate cyclase (GGDEF)-like protein
MALSLLEHVPDPVYEIAIPGNLGEVLLLLGQVAEAQPLLQRSLQLAQARGLHAYAWRVQTSMADWLLASGQAAQARQAALSLLATMQASAAQLTTIRAHDTVYRACRALGLHEEALQHLEASERLERQRTISQLRAQSQLFVTRSEAQRAREQAERAKADAVQQRERAAEFAAAAERDALTGLGNRRHLHRRSAELLPVLAREGQAVSLALLDLDHFKQVNDLHGHAAGDQVLVALAHILRENTRAGDVLTRHGGEEFVVMLPGMPMERAAEVFERLRQRIEVQLSATLPHAVGSVTVSVGLTSAPPHDLPLLLQRADQALYRAKRQGRNQVVTSD